MKVIFAYLMGFFYIIAGYMHFAYPAIYFKIIPKFLPCPMSLVYLSGIAEILCGMGFLFDATRAVAAWGTIILLIAIFPANINMAIHSDQFKIAPWILNIRLPLQFLLIWFAYLYSY